MSNDVSLFGDDSPSETTQPVRMERPIADWQVDLVRKVLDARGLTNMAKRKETVEAAAGRTVESLRALTHNEAMQVLTRLGEAPATGRRSTSLWDDRDEDTWIDRL